MRYLIALLAALALIAASVATQAHTTEGTIPTLEQFRSDRIAIRQRADHIKADVKCRGHVHPFVHTAGYFDRQRRPGVLRYWRGRVVAMRGLAARCYSTPEGAIRYVFGAFAEQAISVAYCESKLYVYARNGQYLGMFQMGEYARSAYGHSWTALGQAQAAYRYFVASGRDWSPWQCRPWGLAW